MDCTTAQLMTAKPRDARCSVGEMTMNNETVLLSGPEARLACEMQKSDSLTNVPPSASINDLTSSLNAFLASIFASGGKGIKMVDLLIDLLRTCTL